jgi:hypothetical protein
VAKQRIRFEDDIFLLTALGVVAQMKKTRLAVGITNIVSMLS